VAVHDDVVEVGLAVLIDCEFVGFETLDGLLLLFSSGLLRFSGLLGVLASLGLLPEPPPLISPPPSGGQKGHTQEGLRSPNPPVPPDHLSRSLVPRSTTNSTQANVPGSARSYYNNCSRNCKLTVIAIGLDYRRCHRYGSCDGSQVWEIALRIVLCRAIGDKGSLGLRRNCEGIRHRRLD